MNRGLILDRDGVIIEDVGYPFRKEHISFIWDSIVALRLATKLGYTICVATNQSGIARGLFDISDYLALEEHLKTELQRHGVSIARTYFCPHLPTGLVKIYSLDCNCRKPKPGLLQSAIKDFNLDPKESLMVGDRTSDVLAGHAAGIEKLYLLKTTAKASSTMDAETAFPKNEISEIPHFKGTYTKLTEIIESQKITPP